MDILVKMLLKVMLRWIMAHPESPFSKFMLKKRGPRQDVKAMTRFERFGSALGFLSWGIVFAALWALLAFLQFGLGVFAADNVIAMVASFGLVIFAGIGIVGGLYLLLRVVI